jgi:hypothetical protein
MNRLVFVLLLVLACAVLATFVTVLVLWNKRQVAAAETGLVGPTGFTGVGQTGASYQASFAGTQVILLISSTTGYAQIHSDFVIGAWVRELVAIEQKCFLKNLCDLLR